MINVTKGLAMRGRNGWRGDRAMRPIGAREAAQNTQTCLGPYATRDCVQPHTGHNTHGLRQASSRLP